MVNKIKIRMAGIKEAIIIIWLYELVWICQLLKQSNVPPFHVSSNEWCEVC